MSTCRELSRGGAGAAASVCAGGTATGGRVGSKAPMPLPRALRGCSGLLMLEDLFSELDIAFCPLGAGVVCEDGLAETRGFSQPNAAGDDGPEDLFFEEFLEVGRHLAGQIRT